MPVYTPLETPVPVSAMDATLMMARWKDGTFFVDFQFGRQGAVLRASFLTPMATRVLNNIIVAEVEPSRHLGASRDHLAYVVTDADFWRDHVFSLRTGSDIPRHFRFLAKRDCIDVLSAEDPIIKTITAVVEGGRST